MSEPSQDEIKALSDTYNSSRRTMYVAFFLLIALIVTFGLIPVPYVMLSPGPIFNTLGAVNGTDLITIKDAPTYPTAGTLDLTTVTERGGPYGPMTIPESMYGWLNPQLRVVPRDFLYPPDVSNEDARAENTQSFTTSQSDSTAAALNYLKIPVTTQTFVVSVGQDAPAQGKLQSGDVIKKIDGHAIVKPEDVRPLIQALGPNRDALFSIERDGKSQDVTVTTGASPADPAVGYIGVTVGAENTGPFPITFGLSDIGGPSAGTMFSLGIIDKLTPGELNGGKNVAGTGTITPDGKVGPIGGIEQKIFAAKNNGVELFLAPAANCDQVRGVDSGNVVVTKIATLKEAVDALALYQTNPAALPKC